MDIITMIVRNLLWHGNEITSNSEDRFCSIGKATRNILIGSIVSLTIRIKS